VVRVQLQYSSIQHGECRSCFLRPWVDRVVGGSLGCGSNVSHLSLRYQMHISNILLQNMCSACVLVRHVYMISSSGVMFPSSSSALFGPKLGTRAMVQCRFSWGYVHVLGLILNLEDLNLILSHAATMAPSYPASSMYSRCKVF